MLESRKNDSESERSAFTRVLRYWRSVLGVSQSGLSDILNTSTRHISFLETGRSRPSKAMLQRLESVFEISQRDTETLWYSAGYVPESIESGCEKEELDQMEGVLHLMLEKHDPYPAFVINRCGDVLLWNASFYRLFRRYAAESLFCTPLNIYRLYLCEGGVRGRIKDWEFLACRMLLALRQEYFLSGSPTVKALFEELCGISGIPDEWSERARGMGFSSASYRVGLKGPEDDGDAAAYDAAVTAVLPASGGRSSLLVHSYYPVEG
jgi:transcriptional regulator with XRE-family HTH domain